MNSNIGSAVVKLSALEYFSFNYACSRPEHKSPVEQWDIFSVGWKTNRFFINIRSLSGWIVFGNGTCAPPWKIEIDIWNLLRSIQNGRRFAYDIVKSILLNANSFIFILISLKFFRKSPIDNKLAVVQIMTWPMRRKAIIWTKYGLVYWHIHVYKCVSPCVNWNINFSTQKIYIWKCRVQNVSNF